ncbi:MAG: polysaccharide pyruvyl transferase family protein [Chloroflexota bacterium]|nr:polysaccharide pyruvyl transferase family protein [Chloroflexota bacterium]
MSKTGRHRSRIVILGWYGSSNTGDEAVLQAVVQSLQASGYNDLNDLLVLSTEPQKTSAWLGVPSAPRGLTPGSIKALWGAKALVLGGGGLIQDSSSVYNLPIYALYVAIARLRGLKVVAWGLGVGPLRTPLGRALARFIYSSAGYFSVRDEIAAMWLARLGVPPDKVMITADPAFLIRAEPVPPDSGGVSRIGFCIRHPVHDKPGLNLQYLLPVSLRHRLRIGGGDDGSKDEAFVFALARAIRLCTEEIGAKVVLLPLWPGRDDEIIRRVEAKARELGVGEQAIEWAQVEPTPGAILNYIGNLDMLVSMRLHALIFAANKGVPVLALSYVGKVRGLMRMLGQERWVIEVETRTPSAEELEMKINLLWHDRAAQGQALKEAARRAKARASQDELRIASLLGE